MLVEAFIWGTNSCYSSGCQPTSSRHYILGGSQAKQMKPYPADTHIKCLFCIFVKPMWFCTTVPVKGLDTPSCSIVWYCMCDIFYMWCLMLFSFETGKGNPIRTHVRPLVNVWAAENCPACLVKKREKSGDGLGNVSVIDAAAFSNMWEFYGLWKKKESITIPWKVSLPFSFRLWFPNFRSGAIRWKHCAIYSI